MQNKFAVFAVLLFAYGWCSEAKTIKGVNNRKVAQAEIIAITLEDTVFRLKEDDQEVRVYFLQHAGVYSIQKDSKQFSQLLGAVTKSKESNKRIKISVDATSLEIQEVLTLQTPPSPERSE